MLHTFLSFVYKISNDLTKINTIHVLAPLKLNKSALVNAPRNPLTAANSLNGYLNIASIAQ